jgi:adenosylcobinamide-phosphate synthase
LLAGVALDALLGDPRRWHPVAGFGAVAGAIERRTWRDAEVAGVGYVVACVAPPVAVAALVDAALRRRPMARAVVTAAVTWTVVGAASLAREAGALAADLERGDVAAARLRLPALCGRDPSTLDAHGLARAVVESVAENTSDAAVAPLVWGALLGPPGLVGYRAINTLDAMVGYRSARYARFGWAAARLDDLVNLAPARLTGALAVVLAGVVGGDRRKAYDVWLRYGSRHPSPNAGWCEAAFAGALDRTLGGRNRYGARVEDRPALGDGPPPGAADVARAVRLSRAVVAAATAACVAAVVGRAALR